MKPRLVIEDGRDHGYQIAWFFPDEDDIGGVLGESVYADADLAKCDLEDRDHIIATIAAGKTPGAERRGNDGFFWKSRDAATKALAVIKAAINNDAAPWPEWAVKAKAAGWKEPKGWRP